MSIFLGYKKTPTKGIFRVTKGDGTILFSVGPEKRPFQQLRAVDMDEVTANILKALDCA